MFTKAQKYLAENGIRPSLQRVAVMGYMMEHRTHPTVDEVYAALAPAMPTLSRMTVHNTLSMLAGRGLILALDFNSASMHYDGDMRPHAHFMCTRCGAIHDIEPTPGLLALYSAAPPRGVTVSSAQMIYKGVCAVCNARAETPEAAGIVEIAEIAVTETTTTTQSTVYVN